MAIRIELSVVHRIKYEKHYRQSRLLLGRDIDTRPSLISYVFRRLAEEMGRLLKLDIGEINYPAFTFIDNDSPRVWYWYKITLIADGE